MQQNMFHGILVNMAFIDPGYPETYSIFAKEKIGDWILYGIEVPRNTLELAVIDIQTHMRADEPFYAHLYDDELVVVIFRTQVFRVTPHISSWGDIRLHGAKLNIPVKQLDFWPNRFQDELHYFKPDSFIESIR
jgi:hypothetical protein